MRQKEGFEIKIDSSGRLVELGGGRLLICSTAGDPRGCYSGDGGRTWDNQFALQLKMNSICRLSTGQLGGLARVTADEVSFFKSNDEGKTWTDEVPLGQPGEHLVCHDGLIQLRSGRLVAGVYCAINDYKHPEYKGEGVGHDVKGGYGSYQGRRVLVEGHSHTPEFGWVQVYYSDDLGVTWEKSANNLWIWPLPSEAYVGGHSPLWEPVEVELEDDHILMLMRAEVGVLYQSESLDAGETWSIPRATELASSGSPCKIAKIPSTGDLVVVWNQVSANEIFRGLKRARICCAISDDQARTWKNFKTLDRAAVPEVSEIEPPPIRSYHSLEDVGEVPAGFGCFDYPDIAFADDMILFNYAVQEMKEISEWPEQTTIAGERMYYGKIKALPIGCLYDSSAL